MEAKIKVLAVELDGTDGILATFSDGTTAGYVIEELLDLRPVRERARIEEKNATAARRTVAENRTD